MPVQKLPRDRYQLLPSVKFVNKKAEGEVDDHQPINKLKTIQGLYQSDSPRDKTSLKKYAYFGSIAYVGMLASVFFRDWISKRTL